MCDSPLNFLWGKAYHDIEKIVCRCLHSGERTVPKTCLPFQFQEDECDKGPGRCAPSGMQKQNISQYNILKLGSYFCYNAHSFVGDLGAEVPPEVRNTIWHLQLWGLSLPSNLWSLCTSGLAFTTFAAALSTSSARTPWGCHFMILITRGECCTFTHFVFFWTEIPYIYFIAVWPGWRTTSWITSWFGRTLPLQRPHFARRKRTRLCLSPLLPRSLAQGTC